MELAYELTEADLEEVQRHRAALQRRFFRGSWVVVVVTIFVGVMLWPFASEFLAAFPGGALPVWLLVLIVAGAIVMKLRPVLPHVRYRGLERWSLKRMTAASVKRSALGPVTLVLTSTSLKRLREGAPALEVTRGDLTRLSVSSTTLVIHLSGRRVLVAPRRAFTDDATALAFQQRVEALAAKTAEVVGPND